MAYASTRLSSTLRLLESFNNDIAQEFPKLQGTGIYTSRLGRCGIRFSIG